MRIKKHFKAMIDITGNYIHLFETQSEYETERTTNYKEPWVSYTKATSAVTYNKTEIEKPLTFEITAGGLIYWNTSDSNYRVSIQYSKNGGEWTTLTSTSYNTSLSVAAGDIVQFRGDNAAYTSGSGSYKNTFGGTSCQFKVRGNIMSLLNSTVFATATTLQSAYTFYELFYNCTGLTDASNLVLPATTLTQGCYEYMFMGCTSLTTAPELPATTLADECYYYMFSGCTSLTTAPELPATTLATRCYNAMFVGCTNLTQAPSILPATTLAQGCYYFMFRGCSSLTTAPSSIGTSATTMANSACSFMFSGCTNLTTAPELPATTLADRCYKGMFYGCTRLATAPELPATTMVSYCYESMFSGCTNLNYIKCLATSISATSCRKNWVSGVQTSSGTFVKNASMTGWPTGTDGIPENWTVQDA